MRSSINSPPKKYRHRSSQRRKSLVSLKIIRPCHALEPESLLIALKYKKHRRNSALFERISALGEYQVLAHARLSYYDGRMDQNGAEGNCARITLRKKLMYRAKKKGSCGDSKEVIHLSPLLDGKVA